MVPQKRVQDRTSGAPARSRAWLVLAVVLWVVPMIVISVTVGIAPEKRTVTPLYHDAAAHWQAREPLYVGPAGMNYLPSFALLFAPYHALPSPWGDIAWRWTSAGLFAAGFGRWLKAWPRGSTSSPAARFVILSAIALPLILPALRNGQANATLGGLFLLAAAFLRERQWTLAAVFLGLTVAVKPLGIAAVGLALAAFPAAIPAILTSLFVVGVLPFLTAPTSYATTQFAASLENLRQCSATSEHRFADLNGILRTFGTELTGTPGLAVRAGVGALLFGCCFLWVRRQEEPWRSLTWYGFASAYLMLFNPMTEANSYAVLAPVLSLWAAAIHLGGSHRNAIAARILVAMALTMGLLPNVVRPWLGNHFALFWHPTMTLIFTGGLLWKLASDRRLETT